MKLALLLVVMVAAKHPIDLEIEKTQSSLDKFAEARGKLMKKAPTNDLTPLEVTHFPQEWLLSKFIPRKFMHFNTPVVNIQFVTLKPIGPYRDVVNSQNVAWIIAYSDGMVEVQDNSGQVLCSYNLTYPAMHLATTANYDEIKFATISPSNILEIFEIAMDKNKKLSDKDPASISFTIVKENTDVLHTTNPTALLYYVKTGKKFWVIGDNDGTLFMHMLNGTMTKHTHSNLGKITSLERFGQTLIFSTNTSVGVINPNTLEIMTVCHEVRNILDTCIDTMSSTSFVYAITSEQVIAMDTKYNSNNENFCKGKD